MTDLARHFVVALIEHHPHAVVVADGVTLLDTGSVGRIEALPHLVSREQINIDVLRVLAVIDRRHEHQFHIVERLPARPLVQRRERNPAVLRRPHTRDLGLAVLRHLVGVRETPARLALEQVTRLFSTLDRTAHHQVPRGTLTHFLQTVLHNESSFFNCYVGTIRAERESSALNETV